ncbi:hypothetical protein GCM10022205_28160 [Spinactinospora alkalitolerans]
MRERVLRAFPDLVLLVVRIDDLYACGFTRRREEPQEADKKDIPRPCATPERQRAFPSAGSHPRNGRIKPPRTFPPHSVEKNREVAGPFRAGPEGTPAAGRGRDRPAAGATLLETREAAGPSAGL